MKDSIWDSVPVWEVVGEGERESERDGNRRGEVCRRWLAWDF